MPAPPDHPFGHSGDYASWDEAFALCTDYQPEFEDKVCQATLAVLEGRAAYTRDGGLHDEIEYFWPTLAGLMYAAARDGGRLEVVDFGGALGTTYLQNRRFLDRLGARVHWHIVERPVYVAFGRRHMRDPRLSFHASLAECLGAARPNVLLASGVLQSLPDPYRLLDEVAAASFDHVVLDRVHLNAEPRDRLTIFRAPAAAAANQSRPWWMLSEARLLQTLGRHFTLVERFDAIGTSRLPSRFKGFVFSRTTAS